MSASSAGRAGGGQRGLPALRFDPALPVNQNRDTIRAALERHRVVVVCGETGSGKTTQLPKILLEMGRGKAGYIGHTQPRRVAARAVAARLAHELGVELGKEVGYKVRFQDRVRADSLVKLMTDGILLAETQGDPLLRQYDTLIVDEAHERSLNIDFLLGYLKRLLPERPDLKLVITSATIDAGRFARHFDGAPAIEVSGRLYPVEIRYRPVSGDAEDTTRDEEEQALLHAVEEASLEGPGDILVFLPGEREIRDAAEVLRKQHASSPVLRSEIVPLYGRLSAAEQDRVFRPGPARRVVLATNVAETSLTVPRIRYVVDTGFARVKRYSYRHKVEQLRVEPVSQAAARQRAGRCGRVADGVCLRLYSEEDFVARAPFSDPEVLRSSLAGVILRAENLNLGNVVEFPFLDTPSAHAFADGYELLAELGAVDDKRALTQVGRELARLPLDPRVGRMLVAARAERCLEQVLVIAAALSVLDPRERPLEREDAADERHARFVDERSDFVSLLKLWNFFDTELDHKKSNHKLAQACRDQFLSLARMREWRDVHAQLHASVADLGWQFTAVDPTTPQGYRAIHRALLAGLLASVGLRNEPDAGYAGARGIKFRVHPSSGVRKTGKWIVAAELMQTTRLYARNVATVDSQWVEEIGAHLMKRQREHPRWEKACANVVAIERGTLYGLQVYANRRVSYGALDPSRAREIFLQAALVEGEFDTPAPFFAHNHALVHEIERLEQKARRPDILVDDALIYAFYDARVPAGVYDGAAFEKWRMVAERTSPRLLFLRHEDLMRHEAAGITTEKFPHRLRFGPNELALEYHFEPGSARDGVTLTIPVMLLNQVPAARCEWLVPGLLQEKVQALTKSMPQRLRCRLGPLANFAGAFIASVPPSDTPLAQALASYIRTEFNLEVPVDVFRHSSAPPYLHMNFRLLDEHGRQLAMGRDLADLKSRFAELTTVVLRAEAPARANAYHRDWIFGDLAEVMEIRRAGLTMMGFPALVDVGDGVVLEVFDSPERAAKMHRAGVRRLLAIAFRDRLREIEKQVARDTTLNVRFAQLAPHVQLKDELVSAALERCFFADTVPTTRVEFSRRVDAGRSRLSLIAQEMTRIAATVLNEHAELHRKLGAVAKVSPSVARDVEEQCKRLLHPHFLSVIEWPRLQHLPRYLKAASLRLDKVRADPARDARLAAQLVPLQSAWGRELAARAKRGSASTELEQFGWLLEELRVSLFAQELKTPIPVSVKRLVSLWGNIRGR